MARFNSLPAGALQQVSADLSAALPRSSLAYSLGSAGVDEVQVAESVDIWLLPLDGVRNGESLEAALVSIDRWHHQLKAKGHALGYATSAPDEQSPLSQLRLSEIADDWRLSSAFDRAIDAIELHHPGEDADVRLIIAPAYRTWALYSRGEEGNNLYILSSPLGFQPDLGMPFGLPRLSEEEFMRQLSEAPFEEGLVEA